MTPCRLFQVGRYKERAATGASLFFLPKRYTPAVLSNRSSSASFPGGSADRTSPGNPLTYVPCMFGSPTYRHGWGRVVRVWWTVRASVSSTVTEPRSPRPVSLQARTDGRVCNPYVQGWAEEEVTTMGPVPVSVGIDVAKATLVIAVRPTGECWETTNEPRALSLLARRLRTLGPPVLSSKPPAATTRPSTGC